MESPENIIFLYSKYSNHCNKIYNEIVNNSLQFINTLCIDNKNVRQRIKKSMYQIKYVPCFLNVYKEGNVEKFEGEQAVKWFDEIIKNIQNKKDEESKIKLKKQLEDEELRIEKLRHEQQLLEQENQLLKQQLQNKPEQSSDGVTSINDLLGEESTGISSSKSITGPNDNQLLDLDDLSINKYEDLAKKKVSTNTILNKAAELQKARDMDDIKKKPIN